MKPLSVWRAQFWQIFYKAKNWLLMINLRHGTIVGWSILLLLIVLSGYFTPRLQNILDPYFSVQGRFNGFQTLLVTLGSALIGATAIAFTLIMFAMQVNVERMPHGLFRKFSSDPRLLGSFAVTFFIAVTITCFSLIPDKSWVAATALGAAWGTVLIITFFLIAYQRALNLISPTKQLSILVVDTKKNCNYSAYFCR